MAVPDVAGAAAVGPDVLAAAVDASPDGVALLDEQGRCVYVNAAGCALLGAPSAELVGRPTPFPVPTTTPRVGRAHAGCSGGRSRGPRASGSWSTGRGSSTIAGVGSSPSPSGT